MCFHDERMIQCLRVWKFEALKAPLCVSSGLSKDMFQLSLSSAIEANVTIDVAEKERPRELRLMIDDTSFLLSKTSSLQLIVLPQT